MSYSFILNIFIDFALLLIPIYFGLKEKKKPLHIFGIKNISTKEFLKYSVLTFVLLVSTSIVFGIGIDMFRLNDTNAVSETIRNISNESPLLLAYLLVIRVFTEEVFFRAFLVEKTNIFVSSLLFALVHFGYGSIAEIAGAFVLGIVLAFMYSKAKNIIPIFVAHFLYNAVSVVAIFS